MRACWQQHRYEPVMRAIQPALKDYDQLRRQSGQLNYQDLLMLAASLLRDKPHVRQYFRRRWTHLLVDEFQDTDPIQAEVMLLLTADDPKQTEWHQCRPAAGSLFVVGDPKQSIYRFRRADIVTYNQVRRIIQESGCVVPLTANFRTVGSLIDWINGHFQGVFPEQATTYAPANCPMQVGRQEGQSGQMRGLHVLSVPPECSRKDQAVAHEADVIARTIRDAVDRQLAVPRSRQELQRGVGGPASYGDFLIITRNTAHLSDYAAALQAHDIPHQVTGSSSLNQVVELALLHSCLSAVLQPDNPVALVAVLRGELFGFSDAALYAFKRAGGRFCFRTPLPDGLEATDAAAFQEAWERLQRYAHWMASLPAVAATEKILADLGLVVLTAAAPGGNIQAGSIGKAVELLRAEQSQGWSASHMVAYLGQLLQQEEKYDGLPARSPEVPRVRVMNLHKAKGLEAPVVFLADPSGDSEHPVKLHVDRSGQTTRGFLVLYRPKGAYQQERLACPCNWEALESEEARFEAAEHHRLMYVAATRAGCQLNITQRLGKGNRHNPWQFFAESLDQAAELPPIAATPPDAGDPIALADADVATALAGIQSRWGQSTQLTYRTTTATATASLSPAAHAASGPEHGTEWGTLIHRLLETALSSPAADLHAVADLALADLGLGPTLLQPALALVRKVMASAILKRAQASPRRLVEVPFELAMPAADGCPSILRGVIDLAFQEGGGWVIVDYKTDGQEQAFDELVEQYRGQLQTYAQAWQTIVRQPVQEIGLYFASFDRYVRC